MKFLLPALIFFSTVIPQTGFLEKDEFYKVATYKIEELYPHISVLGLRLYEDKGVWILRVDVRDDSQEAQETTQKAFFSLSQVIPYSRHTINSTVLMIHDPTSQPIVYTAETDCTLDYFTHHSITLSEWMGTCLTLEMNPR